MVLAPRILIVDDEVHVRKLFVAVLAESGFAVTAAQNGRHALSLLSDAEFDVVILDMCLPDMDGLELIRRLHGDYPFLKIAAVSGFMGGTLQREAMSAGADATLSKPTTAMRLRNTVYALLDGVPSRVVNARSRRALTTAHRVLAALTDGHAAHSVDTDYLRRIAPPLAHLDPDELATKVIQLAMQTSGTATECTRGPDRETAVRPEASRATPSSCAADRVRID